MSRLILVVDDSPTACSIVRRVLEREWWVVETYLQPLLALQMLWQRADDPPAALILDIQLPHLDGYQITQMVRNSAPKPLRLVPIIGLSARDRLLDRVKGRVAGMDAYLTKPFDPADLLQQLSTLPVGPHAVAHLG